MGLAQWGRTCCTGQAETILALGESNQGESDEGESDQGVIEYHECLKLGVGSGSNDASA
jgi:hypothetical protein